MCVFVHQCVHALYLNLSVLPLGLLMFTPPPPPPHPSSFFLLSPAMCGITSGICFIAVRDLDNTTFRTRAVIPPAVPEYASQSFHWSFMLHWIATGLAFVDSCLLLCLLKNSYERVNDNSKFSPYNNI